MWGARITFGGASAPPSPGLATSLTRTARFAQNCTLGQTLAGLERCVRIAYSSVYRDARRRRSVRIASSAAGCKSRHAAGSCSSRPGEWRRRLAMNARPLHRMHCLIALVVRDVAVAWSVWRTRGWAVQERLLNREWFGSWRADSCGPRYHY